MAATFCIPKPISEQIKGAIKQGIFTASKLYNTDATGRLKMFQTFIPDETLAKQVSQSFEDEMVSRQKTGISRWINSQTEGVKEAQIAADKLNNMGVLNTKSMKPALRTIVEQSKGVGLSDEQIKAIGDQAKVTQDTYANKDENGRTSLEYWQQRSKLDSIMTNLDPKAGSTKRGLSQLSKGGLLTSFPSMGKAAFSQFVQTELGKLDRRLSSTKDPITGHAIQKEGSFSAIRVINGMNSDMAKSDVKADMDVYYKTGYLPSKSLDSSPSWQGIGEKRVGVTTEGTGFNKLVNKAAQVQNDYLMKYGHGLAHALTYTHSFYDELNVQSTKLALASGKVGEDATEYAQTIYKDARSETPQTNEGIALRAQAQSEAEYRANINNSNTAQAAEYLKAAISKIAGNNVADVLMPIVRVGANAADKALNLTFNVNGGYMFKSLISGITQIKMGETPEGIAEISKGLVKQGVSGAAILGLAYAIGPDNYQGVPTTTQQRDEMVARGAKPNSVKIGNEWISLGYFQMLAPSLSGMLSALQAPSGSKLGAYAKGTGEEVANEIPGVNSMNTYLNDFLGTGKISYAGGDVLTSLYSRAVPSIVSYAAKASDPNARVTTNGTFDYIKSEIPGLRETLPVEKSETGKDVPNNPFEEFLFGSTVSRDTNDPVVNEIQRLGTKGVNIDLTKPQNETRFKDLQREKGQDVYQQAVNQYSSELNSQLNTLMQSPLYKNSNVTDKKKQIEAIHTQVMDSVTSQYGYTKPIVPVSTDY